MKKGLIILLSFLSLGADLMPPLPPSGLRIVRDDLIIWEFSIPTQWGILPTGWMDSSAPGSSLTFRATTFSGRRVLHIKSTGNTWDRVKVATSSTYKDGVYEWKVFIPAIPEDNKSVAIDGYIDAFEFDPGYVEIDAFEIGYGTSEARAQYGIQDGEYICIMTMHAHSPTGTKHSWGVTSIEPGNWYIFKLVLDVNTENKYVVSWYLKKEGEENFRMGREPAVAGYGPDDFSFHILVGVENYKDLWIGDEKPILDHNAYYDYISFKR